MKASSSLSVGWDLLDRPAFGYHKLSIRAGFQPSRDAIPNPRVARPLRVSGREGAAPPLPRGGQETMQPQS
jgi:hypothetical protein